MTDIYLEPGAAALPNAVDQLRHLPDTGHRLFILGDVPATIADLPSIVSVESLPEAPVPGSWLLTTDSTLCADRHPPLMSMLIGPRPEPSPRSAPRCDAEARDLASAVLEILRHEAMG